MDEVARLCLACLHPFPIGKGGASQIRLMRFKATSTSFIQTTTRLLLSSIAIITIICLDEGRLSALILPCRFTALFRPYAPEV